MWSCPAFISFELCCSLVSSSPIKSCPNISRRSSSSLRGCGVVGSGVPRCGFVLPASLRKSKRRHTEQVSPRGAALEVSVLGRGGELTGAPVMGVGVGHVPALLPLLLLVSGDRLIPAGLDATSRTASTGRERLQRREKITPGAILAAAWSVVAPRSCGQAGPAVGRHDGNVPAMPGFHLSLFLRGSPGWRPGCIPAAARLPARGGLSEASFSACTVMNQHTLFSSVEIGLPFLGRRRRLAVDSSAASLGLCCRRGRQDSAAVCVSFGAELFSFLT